MKTQKERWDEMIAEYKAKNTGSLEAAVGAFLDCLDRVEDSESGRLFRPTTIGSCRLMESAKLGVLLEYFREATGKPFRPVEEIDGLRKDD